MENVGSDTNGAGSGTGAGTIDTEGASGVTWGELTLQEFNDWTSTLSEQRHGEVRDAFLEVMASPEHLTESVGQFLMRLKATMIEGWAAR